MYNEDSRKKKRYAIIGISSLLLVAMVIGATVGVGTSFNKGSDGTETSIKSSMKAIKTICQPTDYKQTCETTLTSAAGNTTDPKELIKAAFAVAEKKLAEGMKKSTVLKELEKDPRASKALAACKDLMDSAIAEFKKSVNHLNSFDFSKTDEMLEDIRIWLSSTITDQETCLDGFQNTTSTAGEKMKAALKTARELSSNALAMVSELKSVLGDLDIKIPMKRRLLNNDADGDVPLWVAGGQPQRKLLQIASKNIKPHFIVAKDGSSKYKTINSVLKHLPIKSNKTIVLYIKEGVYHEQVLINKTITNLMIIGDGPLKTRITGKLNFHDGTPTFQTATFAVQGENFIAKDIGFENSAGPEKHQAVALRNQADKSIFYNCRMDGYQDTLYAHTNRQFYSNCVITGTIDFIFGDAASFFQNCTILVRKPMDNQQCIVTAQGRKERRQPTGIVLQNCTITADESYTPHKGKFKSYLGRPWKEYSRTVIMESHIDDLIHKDGWLPWNQSFALKTLLYVEFHNRGPGADTSERVKWAGIKIYSPERILRYTSQQFLKGNLWIPKTGVPYTAGFVYKAQANETSKAKN